MVKKEAQLRARFEDDLPDLIEDAICADAIAADAAQAKAGRAAHRAAVRRRGNLKLVE